MPEELGIDEVNTVDTSRAVGQPVGCCADKPRGHHDRRAYPPNHMSNSATHGLSDSYAWIVTVHNKARLLRRVLDGIAANMDAQDRLVVVLDGCTDRSADAAESFQRAHPALSTSIVSTPDLHEIGAINAGLAALGGHSFRGVFIVQDDVVLLSTKLRLAVERVAVLSGGKIGCVSFRMGCYLSGPTEDVPFWQDFVESAYGHRGRHARRLRPQHAIEVDLAFKSPIFYSSQLLERVRWQMDPDLMPHSMDDLDLSLHARAAGLRNYAVAAPMRSDMPWGGTREFAQGDIGEIGTRNARRVRRKHTELVAAAAAAGPQKPGAQTPVMPGPALRARAQAALGVTVNSALMAPALPAALRRVDGLLRTAVWRASRLT